MVLVYRASTVTKSVYPETTGAMVQIVDADPPTNSQPAHCHGSL
jgi:hypothetical protein